MAKLQNLFFFTVVILCACASTSKQAQDDPAVTVVPQTTATVITGSTPTPAVKSTDNNACALNTCQDTAKIDFSTWLTYTHLSGVSFRYPSDRQLDLSRLDQGQVRLVTVTNDIPITIFIDGAGSPRDFNEFYQQDQRKKHGQNEDNAGIRWLSEYRSHGVMGYMYVWGPDIGMSDQLLGGDLRAVLIRVKSSEQQLQTKHYVEVIWPINRESDLQYAKEHGIERMVKERFAEFEALVRSIEMPE